MTGFAARYSAFDLFQQRHRWLGFSLAVLQKYADDQGVYHAAAINLLRLLRALPTAVGPDDDARLRSSESPPPREEDRRLGARPGRPAVPIGRAGREDVLESSPRGATRIGAAEVVGVHPMWPGECPPTGVRVGERST